jgi:hypothetical protein
MRESYHFDDLGLSSAELSKDVIQQVESNIPPDKQEYKPTGREKVKPIRRPDILGSDLATDKLEVKETNDISVGKGLYAKKAFAAGEHVFEFEGRQRSEKFHPVASRDGYSAHSIVVGHDNGTFFIYATPNETSPLRFLNHSCHPNVGRLSDDLFGFVALRPIEEGEELTADYSLLEVNPYWKMENCGCKQEGYCRHTIGSVSSLSAEYLYENWHRLIPEMQVAAIQFSRDPQIAFLRDKMGTEYMRDHAHPFLKNKTFAEILASAHPTIVRERNAIGAKQLAEHFLDLISIDDGSDDGSDTRLAA